MNALTLSTMTEREFGTIFAKLAIQLRWMDADAVAIRSYYDALKDLPMGAISGAATGFAREAGRKFFPSSAEWFASAQTFATAQLRETLTPDPSRTWTHECTACDDTGWESFACPDVPCDRTKPHLPHSFARVCPCRPTNRTWMRHQHFGAGA